MTELQSEQPIGELKFADKVLSTKDMRRMLEKKFANDASHLILYEVPDEVGIHGRRSCDAVVIGNWGSTGRLVHGFEIKISRSDWLRELKHIDKADPFIARCDRWWLLTSSADMVKPGELPDCWGWMHATATGLRVQKVAPTLPQPKETIDKLWALALIRRAFQRSTSATDREEAVQKRLDDQREILQRNFDRERKHAAGHVGTSLETLQEKISRFEKDSGLSISDWKLGNVGELGRVLRELCAWDDPIAETLRRLMGQRDELTGLTEKLEVAIAKLRAAEPA